MGIRSLVRSLDRSTIARSYALITIAVALLAVGCNKSAEIAALTSGPQTVSGTVTVDGVPQANVSVRLQDAGGELTVMTDATGLYRFTDVPQKSYTLRVLTQFPDVQWEQDAVPIDVRFGGDPLGNRDFLGHRTLSGTFNGTMNVSDGDVSHNSFIFDVVNELVDLVVSRGGDNQIDVTGPSLAPTALPLTAGSFDPQTGQISLTATGVIAGFSGIDITITGTVTGGVGEPKTADLTIELGYDGGLPGAQGITYSFMGALDDTTAPGP